MSEKNIPQKELPVFVKNLSLKELESLEEKIMSVHYKCIGVYNLLTSKDLSAGKKDTTLFQIIPKNIVSSFRVEQILEKYEDKIGFEVYLDSISEIVEELETACFVSKPAFWNKTLLQHYKDAFNTFLEKTRARDVLNHCIAELNNNVTT